jgi:hypothetical protein
VVEVHHEVFLTLVQSARERAELEDEDGDAVAIGLE